MHALEESHLHFQSGFRTTLTGAASSSLAETSGSSGEKSAVGTSFPHAAIGMKRSDTFFGSSPEKRVKLEPAEGAANCPSPILLSTSSDEELNDDLPSDFLEPLSTKGHLDDGVSFSHRQGSLQQSPPSEDNIKYRCGGQVSRQFWKAGDYEGDFAEKRPLDGMDHVRVHPKFLHSNATSHKWALGAVAELLDNALDEVIHGATFINVDTLNKQGGWSPMLLFEDNGGGMDPECMRRCMSLGYSAKSKMANTIGQYGNGFKTSTMRLGADVIVFSCSPAREGCRATRSIGLLSYTFLRETGQQDIIVPMVDFEVQTNGVQKLVRGNVSDWNKNMETIKRWSPFSTESELSHQLNLIRHQGTRIIVYNLWENDEGELELDLETDPHDIQVRGVNRDPKHIAMAERLPNSKHFLTYRHSLRSYASILYLQLPKTFKMILRGMEIRHHCLINDLMIIQRHTYRPLMGQGSGKAEDELEPAHLQDSSDMRAVVTLGFVKDAKEHADVQGFNVYHKNRLIKPFWRVWNSAGSQGRGIIGVLEANFVEPAHDKQGFERTSVLARLEARLLKMQKAYWSSHSHKVGYYNHHAKKQQKQVASKPKAASWEESRVEKDSSVSQQQKRLSCRSQGIDRVGDFVPKVFPRSLRSRGRRLPARRFHNDTDSVICNGPAPVLEEASLMHSCTAAHRIDTLHSESQKQLKPNSCGEVNPDSGDSSKKNQMSNVLQMQIQAPDAAQRLRWLETQLLDMEQKLEGTQTKMEEALKERDTLRQELEEERRHGEVNDAELRKKLRDTILRVKELESANKRLQSAQC